MTTKHPWFKFYPGDWLSARRVALMTPAQKGVYIDLLCLAWQEGAIPADPAELAFLLRLSKRVFEPLWEVVQMHFEPSSRPGFLTNKRIETERAQARGRSENGVNAAKSRWVDDAGALPPQCGSNAIQKEKQKERQKQKEKELPPVSPGFDFETTYRQVYPRHEGKSGGMRACKRHITTQAKFDAWCSAVKNYAAHVAGRATEHVKQFDSFMSCWEEYVEFKPSPQGDLLRSRTAPLPPMGAIAEDQTGTL